jgi:hypothetical protein
MMAIALLILSVTPIYHHDKLFFFPLIIWVAWRYIESADGTPRGPLWVRDCHCLPVPTRLRRVSGDGLARRVSVGEDSGACVETRVGAGARCGRLHGCCRDRPGAMAHGCRDDRRTRVLHAFARRTVRGHSRDCVRIARPYQPASNRQAATHAVNERRDPLGSADGAAGTTSRWCSVHSGSCGADGTQRPLAAMRAACCSQVVFS